MWVMTVGAWDRERGVNELGPWTELTLEDGVCHSVFILRKIKYLPDLDTITACS